MVATVPVIVFLGNIILFYENYGYFCNVIVCAPVKNRGYCEKHYTIIYGIY